MYCTICTECRRSCMEYLGRGWSRGKVEIPRQVLPAPRTQTHLAIAFPGTTTTEYIPPGRDTPSLSCLGTNPTCRSGEAKKEKKKNLGKARILIRDWIASFSGSHYFLPFLAELVSFFCETRSSIIPVRTEYLYSKGIPPCEAPSMSRGLNSSSSSPHHHHIPNSSFKKSRCFDFSCL